MKIKSVVLLIALICLLVCGCAEQEKVEVGGIPEGHEIYDVVPMIPVGDTDYLVSARTISLLIPPEGYVYAGKVEKGMYEGCEYYTSEAEPLWIYVKAQINAADEGEEPEYEYFRFVDVEIRGKDYVCVNGVLYVSAWTADHDRNARDNVFGDLRIEGELPDGYTSAGRAEFSGYDTVPGGELSSNTGSEEIFINENDASVVLMRTIWHTSGNVRHTGFNVYIVED